MITLPETYRILVADDEPDVAAVTRLGLRSMRYRGKVVEIASVPTGREAVDFIRQHPDTAVLLLDVVMESLTAGLDACRQVRSELGNRFIRILLRTGQPGIAPEKKAIDEYDIDGYLPKAELTSTRLYASVRTALKAFDELVELERHRSLLKFIHDSVVVLHAFEPLETTLQNILAAAAAISGASLAVLDLETFEDRGNPRRYLVHLSTDPDAAAARSAAQAIAARVTADLADPAARDAAPFGDGFLVPLLLSRELGYGWLYLEGGKRDTLVDQMIPILTAHAANALYSAVAQAMLAAREGPFYDSVTV